MARRKVKVVFAALDDAEHSARDAVKELDQSLSSTEAAVRDALANNVGETRDAFAASWSTWRVGQVERIEELKRLADGARDAAANARHAERANLDLWLRG